ncbi:hypothetical protein Q31b_28500 [Novipirellula aureliae]|uniref:Uncharacterized protein n=1 Tax=Novipirellula aureliae TaxID=2527966 RepID=A0A5C6E1Z3_9BACT|nr:hypothetical protein Q31b_28500 [Novipirellula aureliae]
MLPPMAECSVPSVAFTTSVKVVSDFAGYSGCSQFAAAFQCPIILVVRALRSIPIVQPMIFRAIALTVGGTKDGEST